MGRLAAIAVAPKKRAPMQEAFAAAIDVRDGLVGDARGRRPGRQVTIVFAGSWSAACAELGRELPWTTRRANPLVEGLDPPPDGARLRVGAALLEVTEETAPCQIMERAAAGLRRTLAPARRGGVCCRVVEGGPIAVGDAVEVV